MDNWALSTFLKMHCPHRRCVPSTRWGPSTSAPSKPPSTRSCSCEDVVGAIAACGSSLRWVVRNRCRRRCISSPTRFSSPTTLWYAIIPLFACVCVPMNGLMCLTRIVFAVAVHGFMFVCAVHGWEDSAGQQPRNGACAHGAQCPHAWGAHVCHLQCQRRAALHGWHQGTPASSAVCIPLFLSVPPAVISAGICCLERRVLADSLLTSLFLLCALLSRMIGVIPAVLAAGPATTARVPRGTHRLPRRHRSLCSGTQREGDDVRACVRVRA